MYYKLISLIFILGTFIHIYFLQFNQIIKTNIGFENIKLIENFKNLSINGFGDGSIGFLYSLLITPIDIFINNHLLSAQIINIILLIVSGILLFIIGNKYLHPTYNTIMMILFFISSNIISYTSNIDSLNLYTTLLILLIITIHSLLSETYIKSVDIEIRGIKVRVTNNYYIIKKSIFVSIVLALLFFTVNISIIYLISIFLILLYLVLKKEISFKILSISYITILISFLIIVSPYLYLIKTKQEEKNIKSYTINNITKSYKVNFDKNISNLRQVLSSVILGNINDSYNDKNFMFYKNTYFYAYMLIPIFFILIGLYKLLFEKKIILTEKRNLFPIIFSIIITVLSFFIFFDISIINLFALIPIFILTTIIGAQYIIIFDKEILSSIKITIISFILISIYTQGVLYIYTYNKYVDNNYELLKELGLWLKNSKYKNNKATILGNSTTLSYYSGNDYFGTIPKLKNTKDLIKYIKLNNIDYLVINSMKINNEHIKELAKDNFINKDLLKIKQINNIGQKVILYKIKY